MVDSAPGSTMLPNRASEGSCGVRPPCENHVCAMTTVRPAARKLIATPEISWLPRKVIEAAPCRPERKTDAPIPANRPTQTEPEVKAMAAEKKAAASILPSRPMSKMPARSEKSPARQASRSGVASRTVLSRICRTVRKSMMSLRRAAALGIDAFATPPQRQENAFHRHAHHVVERAGEQDHEGLYDDDHLAADGGHLELKLRAALVERAEQECGEHDAHGMGPAHQRHGDADEARPFGEVEDEALGLAHHDVDGHHPRQAARDQHGDHGDLHGVNSRIDRRRLRVAEGPDLVAKPRVPDKEPDEDAADQRHEEGEVERGGAPEAEEGGELRRAGQVHGLGEARAFGCHG